MLGQYLKLEIEQAIAEFQSHAKGSTYSVSPAAWKTPVMKFICVEYSMRSSESWTNPVNFGQYAAKYLKLMTEAFL